VIVLVNFVFFLSYLTNYFASRLFILSYILLVTVLRN